MCSLSTFLIFTQRKKQANKQTIKLRKCKKKFRCLARSTVFLLCLWSSCPVSLLYPAVDCVMSAWTAWSQCSVSCGLGFLFRQRNILRDARPGGSCGGAQFDSRACFLQACPGDVYFLILVLIFFLIILYFLFFSSVGRRALNQDGAPLFLASFPPVFCFLYSFLCLCYHFLSPIIPLRLSRPCPSPSLSVRTVGWVEWVVSVWCWMWWWPEVKEQVLLKPSTQKRREGVWGDDHADSELQHPTMWNWPRCVSGPADEHLF